MSSDELSIHVERLSKRYELYSQPVDRLKQMVLPKVWRLTGRPDRSYFQEFWALRDVSFDVCRGETVGIVGRNGSGKSTLLQLICGTMSPTLGQVAAHGRVAALLELGSGFNPEFTGRENVYLNAAVLGLTRDEIDSRFDNIAAFADIGEYIDRFVKTYSSGMFMRLAFSVIAHVDADILIVDEALAVGDIYFVQKCMRFLHRFRDAGGTLLFVSHDSTTVTGLCDRAIWLQEGRLCIDGDPKKVTQAYLADFYRQQQGEDRRLSQPSSTTPSVNSHQDFVDARRNTVIASNLRNDLAVMRFDPDAESFGRGGAFVTDVRLVDQRGQPFSWAIGGELVSLIICAEIRHPIENLIIGFIFKNKQGLSLFGDNTYLSYLDESVSCQQGQSWSARFDFRMPILPSGEYGVSVAVSDGTQKDHVVHHWVHEALIVTSHSSMISTGLIGIPMKHIELSCVRNINDSAK